MSNFIQRELSKDNNMFSEMTDSQFQTLFNGEDANIRLMAINSKEELEQVCKELKLEELLAGVS